MGCDCARALPQWILSTVNFILLVSTVLFFFGVNYLVVNSSVQPKGDNLFFCYARSDHRYILLLENEAILYLCYMQKSTKFSSTGNK
jgi:hypothetical protein